VCDEFHRSGSPCKTQLPTLERLHTNVCLNQLFYFVFFISACRYTHVRSYNITSKYARIITAETIETANKMVANMTGPDGTFRPRSRQHQPESQPLVASDSEMQRTSQPPGPTPIPLYHHRSRRVGFPSYPAVLLTRIDCWGDCERCGEPGAAPDHG